MKSYHCTCIYWKGRNNFITVGDAPLAQLRNCSSVFKMPTALPDCTGSVGKPKNMNAIQS